MGISYVAYELDKANHDGKARTSERQYGLICVSLTDVVSDMLFVADCSWHPTFFTVALVFFLLSLAMNVLFVLSVTCKHLSNDEVGRRPSFYALCTILACTAPDVMALLPWADDDFDANGFPTPASFQWAGRLKYLEDVPLLIIQSVYAARFPEHINPTTVMSMIASAVSLFWQTLVRCFLQCSRNAAGDGGVQMNSI